MAGLGHNERVAQEDAEISVRRDRVRLGHEHHPRPKYALEWLGVHAVGEDVRTIGDEIDAVGMDRPGLDAFVAEEFSGLPDRLEGIAGPDLCRHLLERRQRYLVPESLDHVGRRTETDGRADLGGVAAIAGGKLHDDDITRGKPAARRARIA